MTHPRVPTDDITRERLEEWREGLAAAHATPALLVAVGHDEHAGELHIFVPEGTDRMMLRAWLRRALHAA